MSISFRTNEHEELENFYGSIPAGSSSPSHRLNPEEGTSDDANGDLLNEDSPIEENDNRKKLYKYTYDPKASQANRRSQTLEWQKKYE